MKNKTSATWTVILGVFFLYLIYQTTYAWDESVVKEPKMSTATLENKTAFVMISDMNNLGIDSSGIKSLQESLEMWSFDTKREKILLKHRNLLPSDKTQMMVIYDRGYQSFERYSEVLSLIRFPYNHFYEKDLIFSVEGVDENGEVYLSYKNQRIHLKPGESYHVPYIEGFKPKITTIKNYGLYEKKQFVLTDEEELAREMEKNKEPKKVDMNEVEIVPLTDIILTNTP